MSLHASKPFIRANCVVGFLHAFSVVRLGVFDHNSTLNGTLREKQTL